MTELLVALGCALALWKVVDLLGLAWRSLAHGSRAAGRSVAIPIRAFGAWWIRRAVKVARVSDHRDKGLMRLQAETIGMLTSQLAKMQETIDHLKP